MVNRLPTQTSKAFAEQRQLQQDYLKIRQELNSTSSQDEFAKWAKLRRQHDKMLDQLEKKSAFLRSSIVFWDDIDVVGCRICSGGIEKDV